MTSAEHVWVEHLPPAACYELLGRSAVGRLGVLVDSAPEVYPVNFVLDDGTIVFRTDAGTTLRGLQRSPSVCFEVDRIDEDAHTGWSVLVKGRAEEVRDGDELRALAALPLRLWALGEKCHWVRIRPVDVTGRRIRRIDEPPGTTPAPGA